LDSEGTDFSLCASVLNEYDELAGGVAGFHVGVGRADLIERVDVMDRDGETPGGDLVKEGLQHVGWQV
jgi:hypothetical protein